MTADAPYDIASMFKALGDPTRLHIFNFLRQQCCQVALDDNGEVRPVEGPTVGDVCCHITGANQINSTISHHVRELREAGLITVERRGKTMVCDIDGKAVSELSAFFAKETEQDCCRNSGVAKHCTCSPDCNCADCCS